MYVSNFEICCRMNISIAFEKAATTFAFFVRVLFTGLLLRIRTNVGNTCIALRPKKQRTWHEWCYSLKTASFRIGVSMPRLCRVSVRVLATIRNIHRCTYSPTSVRPVTRHESSALSSCKPHSIFALCFLAYRSFLLPTDRIIATRSSSNFISNLSILLRSTDLFECP